MTHIRRQSIKGLKTGDVFVVTRTFHESDVRDFAHISRDYNPVHFDGRFAAAKGFDACICHGLLVAGMLTEIGGQIGWLASGMQLDFKKPVYAGDTIRCEMTLGSIDAKGRAAADVRFINQNGHLVMSAVLTGILPNGQERRIMQEGLDPQGLAETPEHEATSRR